MNRPLWASLTVGMGLAAGALALVPALGQDRGGPAGSQDARRAEDRDDRDRDSGNATDRIDKALQTYHSYRERSGPNLEQTRKEIDRLRDELNELTKLRCDLAVSLAEIRADMMASPLPAPEGNAMAGYPGYSGTGYPGYTAYTGQPNPAGGPGSPGGPGQQGAVGGAPTGRTEETARDDRRAMRRELLNRQLKQVQDQFRGEVEQAQGQADQLVAQLRDLRGQQRQMQERARAEREARRQRETRDREGAKSTEEKPRQDGEAKP